MSEQNDPSDFIDSDFQSGLRSAGPAPAKAGAAPNISAAGTTPGGNRPPSREELESLMSEKQTKLAELKRAQEELERERAGLEDLRRRQIECQTGREEMLKNLTRGIGLLEEAELSTRREADQMTRSLTEFRSAVAKVQTINQESWKQENLTVELTKALTIIENARMEWNSARMKFPVLTGSPKDHPALESKSLGGTPSLGTTDFIELCRIGLAFTWPLVVLGVIILIAILAKR